MNLFKQPNFDFLRWRWIALAISTVIVVAGIAMMATRGLPLGVDFSGGTIVVLDFQKPTSEEMVRSAVEPLPGEQTAQTYGDPADQQVLEIGRASCRERV